MIALFYISIVFFCTYIIGNVLKYGIPESLSETAYLNTKYGFHFFLLFCIFTTFPLLAFWLYISSGIVSILLVILAAIGLITVGAASHYKGGTDRKIHIIASYTTGVCSVVWSIINTSIWPISLLILLLLLAIGWKVRGLTTEGETQNSIIFFGELSAFLNMYISTYVFWLML